MCTNIYIILYIYIHAYIYKCIEHIYIHICIYINKGNASMHVLTTARVVFGGMALINPDKRWPFGLEEPGAFGERS